MAQLYLVYIENAISSTHVPLELLDTRTTPIIEFCPYKHIGILFNGINERVNLQLLCNFVTGASKIKPKIVVVATRHPLEEWQPHNDTQRANAAQHKSIIRANMRRVSWKTIVQIMDEKRGTHDRNFTIGNAMTRATN